MYMPVYAYLQCRHRTITLYIISFIIHMIIFYKFPTCIPQYIHKCDIMYLCKPIETLNSIIFAVNLSLKAWLILETRNILKSQFVLFSTRQRIVQIIVPDVFPWRPLQHMHSVKNSVGVRYNLQKSLKFTIEAPQYIIIV